MKKLISPSKLQKHLEEKYLGFVDEKCRIVSIERFTTLFTFKYSNSVDDIWNYWIKKDVLYCENISGFMFVFPLKKFI